MLKKVIIFIILCAILFSLFSYNFSAINLDTTEYSVDSYYLFDTNHNILMASENTEKVISPSSTAKIMTACIVLESNIDMQKTVTVTIDMIKNVSGRKMYLKEGNILTVEDLLYAMLCGGYNDATQILALQISSSIYEFVQKMNTKAKELGMINTHYLNPTGMNQEGMVTTVSDIAKLAKYISNNEVFIKICSTKHYKLSDPAVSDYISISNRSSLISSYPGLSNFNTGSADDGDCAVLFYNANDLALISIVMNAKSFDTSSNKNYAEICSEKLINYAKNNYSSQVLKKENQVITSLPVKYSISSKNVNVYLQNDLSIFLPNDIDITTDLTYGIYIINNELIAPLNAGDIVGTLTVFHDGILIASVPLIISESISRNLFLYAMDVLKDFVISKPFIIFIAVFILLIILYTSYSKHKFRKKKRKTRKKPT